MAACFHTLRLTCVLMQKRDKQKEEEKKKKAWISQERQKTLERLKTFKEVSAVNYSSPKWCQNTTSDSSRSSRVSMVRIRDDHLDSLK